MFSYAFDLVIPVLLSYGMRHQSLQTPIHIHIGMVWDAIFLRMVVHSQGGNQHDEEQEERKRWPEKEII